MEALTHVRCGGEIVLGVSRCVPYNERVGSLLVLLDIRIQGIEWN